MLLRLQCFNLPVCEQSGKGLVLQPIQMVAVRLLSSPYAAVVACDDHEVVPIHSLQLGKILCSESLESTMAITLFRCML